MLGVSGAPGLPPTLMYVTVKAEVSHLKIRINEQKQKQIYNQGNAQPSGTQDKY